MLWFVKRSLRSTDPRRREQACQKLGLVLDAASRDLLATVLRSKGDLQVRLAAARALCRVDEPSVVRQCLEVAALADNQTVYSSATPSVTLAIQRIFDDAKEPVTVRRAALRTLRALSSLKPMIPFLDKAVSEGDHIAITLRIECEPSSRQSVLSGLSQALVDVTDLSLTSPLANVPVPTDGSLGMLAVLYDKREYTDGRVCTTIGRNRLLTALMVLLECAPDEMDANTQSLQLVLNRAFSQAAREFKELAISSLSFACRSEHLFHEKQREAALRELLTIDHDAARGAAVQFLSPGTFAIFKDADKRLIPHFARLGLEDATLGSDSDTRRCLALDILQRFGAESELASIRETLLPQIENRVRKVIVDVRNASNRTEAFHLMSLFAKIGTPSDAPFLITLLPLWYWVPTATSWGYACNVSRAALQALGCIGDSSVADLLSQLISEDTLKISPNLPDNGERFRLISEARDVVAEIRKKTATPRSPKSGTPSLGSTAPNTPGTCASGGDVVGLPKPTNAETQDVMECAIAEHLQQLSANANLPSILTSPHWGWAQRGSLLPHIQKDSPRRAMNFAVTKIARAAAGAGSRLCDSELRIVIRDPDTTWDKDFGVPTSVLRLDFRIGTSEWRRTVGMGCMCAGGPYLVWDWT